jgi:hypothetical protein
MNSETHVVIKETPVSVEKLLVLYIEGAYTTQCERSSKKKNQKLLWHILYS